MCLDPSIALKTLRSISGRSIIVTSGTISPLSSLVRELGVEFGVVLQNGHVIKNEQLCVQVCTQMCHMRHFVAVFSSVCAIYDGHLLPGAARQVTWKIPFLSDSVRGK